jgi:hypothetical protein
MIPLIWLVGVAAIGAVALAVYWKEIVEWLNGVIKNIMNYYSYNEKTQKWTETTVSKEVNENDVPKHIREKMAQTAKVDISDELQEKLELVNR